MSLSENTKKIQELFNSMQKTITKFEDLKFPHEYTSFEIYKIHIETLNEHIKDNVIAKMSLALFRLLFENKTEFNECTSQKENYIELLVDKLKAKSKDDIEEAKNEIDSQIITLLFNIKDTEKKNLMKELLIKLEKQLEIKCEMYYVLLVLLVESKYDLHILIDYLPAILKEKYPDSTFDFSDVINSGTKFDEFINIFFGLTDKEKNFNYAIFRFNKEKKDILVEHLSLNEIADIILTSTKKNKKGKSKTKKDDNEEKTEDENINNEIAAEIPEENAQQSDENEQKMEEKIQGNNQVIGKKNTDKSESNSIEELKKMIIENNKRLERLEKDNKLLKDDNKLLKDDNKLLKNDNKLLKNDIEKVNNKLTNANNKIMENRKKIASLEFDIKIIGLRDAYKSLIDLLIMIMNLKPYGNIEEKIEAITNVIKNSKKNNAEKIKALLKDTSDVLLRSNQKAHFINLNEDLIKQIIFNLSKFSGNKDYLTLIDTLKSLKIEKELKKLVENRLDKFSKSKDDFINNQNSIQQSIQENPLVSNGNGLRNLMNY